VPAKVSRPLIITKVGAGSEKKTEKLNWPLWPAQNGQNAKKLAQQTLLYILFARTKNHKFF
jgi:hypothetical protein